MTLHLFVFANKMQVFCVFVDYQLLLCVSFLFSCSGITCVMISDVVVVVVVVVVVIIVVVVVVILFFVVVVILFVVVATVVIALCQLFIH